MTSPPERNLLTYWQELAKAADEGELFLDEDAARLCGSACDDYLATLKASKRDALDLGNVQGMGDFESGRALALKFSRKAVGGENNLVDVLDGHIRVVEAMQSVFRKFFAVTAANDAENASAIDASGPR